MLDNENMVLSAKLSMYHFLHVSYSRLFSNIEKTTPACNANCHVHPVIANVRLAYTLMTCEFHKVKYQQLFAQCRDNSHLKKARFELTIAPKSFHSYLLLFFRN